ncbi:MAG: CBS domain-containing protein [Balneolaceae bacterium]
MKVKDVIHRKGSEVHSIGPDAMVLDAIKKMSDLNIGALLVLIDQQLAGIITERDYRDKVILKGKQSKNTPVKEIMTDQIYRVQSTDDLNTCMRIMTDQKIRHLPVVDNEKLNGVISIGDVVKSIIDEQKFEIDSLRDYITGGYPG